MEHTPLNDAFVMMIVQFEYSDEYRSVWSHPLCRSQANVNRNIWFEFRVHGKTGGSVIHTIVIPYKRLSAWLFGQIGVLRSMTCRSWRRCFTNVTSTPVFKF